MAIEIQEYPNDTPSSLTDWQRMININEVQALALNNTHPGLGGYIVKGSCYNLGGEWYRATEDVPITGSFTLYIKLSNNGSTLTAEYVSSSVVSGASWNKDYNGWYTPSGDLLLFDEVRAYSSGVISSVHRTWTYKPTDPELVNVLRDGMSSGWAAILYKDPTLTNGSYTFTTRKTYGRFAYSLTKTQQFAGNSTTYRTVGAFYIRKGSGPSITLGGVYLETSGIPTGSTMKLYSGSTIYYEGTVTNGEITLNMDVTGIEKTLYFQTKQLNGDINSHTESVTISAAYTSTVDIIDATRLIIVGDIIR